MGLASARARGVGPGIPSGPRAFDRLGTVMPRLGRGCRDCGAIRTGSGFCDSRGKGGGMSRGGHVVGA